MLSVTLTVDGMSCGHCVSSVEGALTKIGAKGKVDLAAKSVFIEYEEAKLSVDALKQAIEDQGFDVLE